MVTEGVDVPTEVDRDGEKDRDRGRETVEWEGTRCTREREDGPATPRPLEPRTPTETLRSTGNRNVRSRTLPGRSPPLKGETGLRKICGA